MKKIITIVLVLVAFKAPSKSPGTCQTQYNNASSSCSAQWEMDLQVSNAFSSATGGLSYGTTLAKVARKNYEQCAGRAITARSNCQNQR